MESQIEPELLLSNQQQKQNEQEPVKTTKAEPEDETPRML